MTVYAIKAVPGELGWTAQVLRDGEVVSCQYACPDERSALRIADWYRRTWEGNNATSTTTDSTSTLYVRADGEIDDVLLPDERHDPPSMSGFQRNIEDERMRETT